MAGGCGGTQYGCCADGRTAQIDNEGSNCEENSAPPAPSPSSSAAVHDDDGSLTGGCGGTQYGCCADGRTAQIDNEGSNCGKDDSSGAHDDDGDNPSVSNDSGGNDNNSNNNNRGGVGEGDAAAGTSAADAASAGASSSKSDDDHDGKHSLGTGTIVGLLAGTLLLGGGVVFLVMKARGAGSQLCPAPRPTSTHTNLDDGFSNVPVALPVAELELAHMPAVLPDKVLVDKTVDKYMVNPSSSAYGEAKLPEAATPRLILERAGIPVAAPSKANDAPRISELV
jgi:hypothetical protein